MGDDSWHMLNEDRKYYRQICEKISKYKWVFLFLLEASVEYLLFRSYVLRESVGLIPRNADPTGYLNITYDTYFTWLSGNRKSVIMDLIFHCKNSCAPTLNAFSLFLMGYSRYSLVIWNYIGLALYQFFGGYMVYRFTMKRSVQCIFNGSLLLLGVHFIFAGDLSDCRLDYFTFCMMGLFSLAWSFFLASEEKYYFNIAALFAGISIFVRFSMIIVIAEFVIISLGVFSFEKGKEVHYFFEKILLFVLICLISGGWGVISNVIGFLTYYSNQVGGKVPAWEYNGDWKEHLLYYPIYWTRELFGTWYIVVFIIIALVYMLSLNKESVGKDVIAYNIVFLLLEYITLTSHVVKSWTASSHMMGAIMSLVVFMSNQIISASWNIINKGVVNTFAILVLLMGLTNYFVGTTSEHYEKYDPNIDKIYLAIDHYINETRKENYIYMEEYDGIFDVLDMKNICIYEYEERKRKINFESPVEGLKINPNEQAENLFENIKKSDLIVISKNGWWLEPVIDFGMNEVWEQNRENVWKYLTRSKNFKKLIEITYDDKPIAVFVKTESVAW